MQTAFQARVARTAVVEVAVVEEVAVVAVAADLIVVAVVAEAAAVADLIIAVAEEGAASVVIAADHEAVETLAVTDQTMAATRATMVLIKAAFNKIRAASLRATRDRGQVPVVTLERALGISSMETKVAVETSGITTKVTKVETIKEVLGEMLAVSLEEVVPPAETKDHGETIIKDILVIIIDEEAHQTEVSAVADLEVINYKVTYETLNKELLQLEF